MARSGLDMLYPPRDRRQRRLCLSLVFVLAVLLVSAQPLLAAHSHAGGSTYQDDCGLCQHHGGTAAIAPDTPPLPVVVNARFSMAPCGTVWPDRQPLVTRSRSPPVSR